MAEAVATIGLVASIVTLVEAGKALMAVVKGVGDRSPFYNAITDAAAQVPLLLSLVETIKDEGACTHPDAIGKDESHDLQVVVDACDRHIRLLADIIASIAAERGESRLSVARKTWLLFRRNREISRISQTLESYKTLLSLKMAHQSFAATRKIEHSDVAATFFNVPSMSLLKFVGRREYLDELVASYSSAEEFGARHQFTTVILGMGGQGKTQLALAYCHNAFKSGRFGAIFWIDATNPDSIARSYGDIAARMAPAGKTILNQRSASDYVTLEISKLLSSWLLVLDNFDNPGQFQKLSSYLPADPHGHGALLITSRHRDISSIGNTIHLGPMTEADGLQLFSHRLGQFSMEFAREEKLAVINRFERLPLAIEQSAAYIRRCRLSFADFEQLYSQSAKTEMWSRVPYPWNYQQQGEEIESQVQLNISTTFELSLSRLGGPGFTPHEVGNIMSLLSMFDRRHISEDLARHARDESGAIPSWMLACYTDSEWDRAKFQDIIVELYSMSILESIDLQSTGCSLTLHPMVWEWLRLRIKASQRSLYVSMAMKVMDSLLKIHSDDMDSLGLSYKAWLLANVDSARESARELNNDHSILRGMKHDVAHRFAYFYSHIERLDLAIALYEQLVATVTSSSEKATSEVFDLYRDAAKCYERMGKFAEAHKLYSRALCGREELLGRDHELSLSCARDIGINCRRMLEYSKGEEILRDTLERCRKAYGATTSLYLVTLNGLAVNLRYQKRFIEAEQVSREAVTGILETFGERDNRAQFSRRCLGLILRDQGRYREAEELFLAVLTEQEKLLGVLHSSTIFTARILARLYSQLGDESKFRKMEAKMQGDLGNAIFNRSLWAVDN